MSLLSAWWALAGLLAVPIILLYLLKMRRRPMEVSSTLLWEQVLADLRANAPFQKLRRNLLLLLQLAALAVLVFALCQPVVRAMGVGGRESVVVLDASASMQAADEPDGQTRFARGVEQARRLIDSLRPGDRMMLIVAGPPGYGVRTALTASRGELHAALSQARPYDTPAAVSEALRLAASSLATESSRSLRGKVYLLSDGVGVELPDNPGLEQSLEYIRLGHSGRNVGVTSVSVETAPGGTQKLVVGVGNFGSEPLRARLDFFYGRRDNWVDSRELDLAGGQQRSVELTLSLQPGRLWVVAEAPGDALALDNVGYVLLPRPARPRVLAVTGGNPVLTKFLASAAASELLEPSALSPAAYAGQAADVTLFDGFVPTALPEGDVVLIDPPRDVAGFRRVGQLDRPALTNVRKESHVLRFVDDAADLAVAKAGQFAHDGLAQELIVSDRWPLLAYTTEGPNRRYLIAFHLADSTWSSDPGILLLLGNIVEHAAAERFLGRSQMIASAAPARLVAGAATAEVVGPDGTRHEVPAEVASFAGTVLAGFYQVRRGENRAEFAVNLLSPRESDIQPRSLTTAAGSAVAVRDQLVRMNRPLWPILAIVALVVLMIEWYCYHRRVG